MKRYNKSNDMAKASANPTIVTINRVLDAIKTANEPLTISRIAQLAELSYYQAKASVTFLESFGHLKVITSNGGTCIVFLTSAV